VRLDIAELGERATKRVKPLGSDPVVVREEDTHLRRF